MDKAHSCCSLLGFINLVEWPYAALDVSSRSANGQVGSLLGIPCKEILRNINVLVTIAHRYGLGRMVDDRSNNELTFPRSLGQYLRFLLKLKLAFGGIYPSKAVTEIQEPCVTA